jgi:hypothetical protein
VNIRILSIVGEPAGGAEAAGQARKDVVPGLPGRLGFADRLDTRFPGAIATRAKLRKDTIKSSGIASSSRRPISRSMGARATGILSSSSRSAPFDGIVES